MHYQVHALLFSRIFLTVAQHQFSETQAGSDLCWLLIPSLKPLTYRIQPLPTLIYICFSGFHPSFSTLLHHCTADLPITRGIMADFSSRSHLTCQGSTVFTTDLINVTLRNWTCVCVCVGGHFKTFPQFTVCLTYLKNSTT